MIWPALDIAVDVVSPFIRRVYPYAAPKKVGVYQGVRAHWLFWSAPTLTSVSMTAYRVDR